MRQARLFVAAVALALPPALALPAAPAPRYPLAVRLVLPPASLDARYFHGGGFGVGPVNPSVTVRIGDQTRETYAGTLPRMFAAPADGSAELVVYVTASEIEQDSEGWLAAVEHEIVLRDAEDAEIARWRVRGVGRIVGFGEKAIPRAFLRAAEYAALTFEAEFETPPAAKGWLAAGGYVPQPDAARPSGPPRLTPSPVARARGAHLFADLGSCAVRAGGALNGAVSARAGWAGRTALLQLALDLLPRPFDALPPDASGGGKGHLETLSLGVDAGAQRRLGSHFELQAGAGATVLAGRATARYAPLDAPLTSTSSSTTAFGFAGSVFAGARYSGLLPWAAFRYRVGLEVRKVFGARLDLPAHGRELAVSDLSAGLFLGIELPWGAARSSSARG